MKYAVIGPGRWGSFIAWYLDYLGKDVVLYGRAESKRLQAIEQNHANDLVRFSPNLKVTSDLPQALEREVIIISIGSQNLRELMQTIQTYKVTNKIFVLCMKGLEIKTTKTLSQVVNEHIGPDSKVAIWVGPGHVQEFYLKKPNCMVIDSTDAAVQDRLIKDLASDLIRFYYGDDLIGNEIGAACKNVIGIAAGMLDGYEYTSLKGALIARAPREVARLIKALGGKEISAYGLSHLGDYEATVFSQYSHNRAFGEKFVKKQPFTKLAEGYYTVKAVVELAHKFNVDMPISQGVYDILYANYDPREVFYRIYNRDLKKEFHH